MNGGVTPQPSPQPNIDTVFARVPSNAKHLVHAENRYNTSMESNRLGLFRYGGWRLLFYQFERRVEHVAQRFGVAADVVPHGSLDRLVSH